MKIKLTNLFFLIFLAMECFSQEKSTILFGQISSFKNAIDNIHIVNLNTKLGAVSNSSGKFQLKVSLNDVLLISSIQYQQKKIVITKSLFTSKKIKIYLLPKIIILDEVYLHNLSGNLISDTNNTPKDTLPKHNFVYRLSDLYKKLPPDTNGFLKAPNANPFGMGGGVGASATLPDYRYEALLRLKRELKQKKNFPKQIKKDLGIPFFVEDLKISEEKINNFLTYCEYRNIIEEYNKNNLLQVIKILLEESEKYTKIEK